VELELHARPVANLDVFAGAGYTDARFLSGSFDSGVNVTGKKLHFTPDYTANGGMQYSIAVSKNATAYARAEVAAYGQYQYDNQNTAAQPAYSIANFRAGLRGKHWFAEGWVRNALDTHYVPIALAYNSPSRFIGESGAPVTFGFRSGLTF
jgi:iron complex outermembrane receptor protein